VGEYELGTGYYPRGPGEWEYSFGAQVTTVSRCETAPYARLRKVNVVCVFDGKRNKRFILFVVGEVEINVDNRWYCRAVG
jgi:hypothetical protein